MPATNPPKIPTGFRPKAQVARSRTTLVNHPKIDFNRNAVTATFTIAGLQYPGATPMGFQGILRIPVPLVLAGRIILAAFPATSWLANFRWSLRDEATVG